MKHTVYGLCKTTSPASYSERSHRLLWVRPNSAGPLVRTPLSNMFLLNADLASSSEKPLALALAVKQSSKSFPRSCPAWSGGQLRSGQDAREDMLTILQIHQPTTIDADIPHGYPDCDAGRLAITQKYLIIMHSDGFGVGDVIPQQRPL